jgi:Mg2+ and Co2+ transporter CorA
MAQNDIFKVLYDSLSCWHPPTLVAGIYGMNFKFMPELGWDWGYGYGPLLFTARISQRFIGVVYAAAYCTRFFAGG